MKKIIITILAFVYLATTTGASVTMHYCMGELVENSLWQSEEKVCSKCGMDKSTDNENGCCKNEKKQVKANYDQYKSVRSLEILPKVDVALPVSSIKISPLFYTSILDKNLLSNAFKRSCGIPLYKLNGVFLI